MERLNLNRAAIGRPLRARLSAVEVVGEDVWTFRLDERATVVELAALKHHFPGAQVRGEDSEGRIILEPVAGTPRPSLERLAQLFAQGFKS